MRTSLLSRSASANTRLRQQALKHATKALRLAASSESPARIASMLNTAGWWHAQGGEAHGAALDQLGDPLTQLGRGVDVDLTANLHDQIFGNYARRQRQLHWSPRRYTQTLQQCSMNAPAFSITNQSIGSSPTGSGRSS